MELSLTFQVFYVKFKGLEENKTLKTKYVE